MLLMMPQEALGLPSRNPAANGLATDNTNWPLRTLPSSPSLTALRGRILGLRIFRTARSLRGDLEMPDFQSKDRARSSFGRVTPVPQKVL